ncbi:MAG: hypothetical protein AAF629_06510 [Chloroflexota bacterium]
MSKHAAESFVKLVAQEQKIARHAAQLAEGDWDGLIALAKKHGFVISREALQAVVPETFFTEHPDSNPHFRWSRNTLD